METARHRMQMELLINSLEPWLDQREDGFVGGNMFVYFSLAQVRHQDFKGPDFFAVLGVPKGERKSWVVWEEGKGPDVIIELLSESTAEIDKTTKKQVYENQLKVDEYFWFDPFNPDDRAGFSLRAGRYQAIEPDERSRLISERLGLALVRWSGAYHKVEADWLRWETRGGILLPTPEEIAQVAEQRADVEAQRADVEAQRADVEAQRAETEAQARRGAERRAAEAEAELARLKAQLERK
jgi:Uma2 family endonuclease